MTEIRTELPKNIVPIVGHDRTNAERQRRYRERRRNDSAKVGRNGRRNGKHNGRDSDKPQPIGKASSSAVRYAAQTAGQAAELIEFPASRRVAEVADAPVTETPSDAAVTVASDLTTPSGTVVVTSLSQT